MTFAFRYLKQITAKQLSIFIALFILSIALDQWVKFIMLEGFVWESEAITIGGRALVYNKGVAFSMFSFLFAGALWSDFFIKHYVPLGILIGAGLSNIIDRFVYEGVVDYVYWHYWFDFAIFNLADVLIDISVVLMIYQMLQEKRNGGHDWT